MTLVPSQTPRTDSRDHVIARGRDRVDELDDQLISAIERRAEASAQVQAVRVADGGSRIDLARENQIISRYHQALGPIGRDIALGLLGLCRGPEGSATAEPRHAFLGPVGTFCEAALTALCQPVNGSTMALPSVEAAVSAVRTGQATDAVIPLESSTTGLIESSLDTLLSGVTIVREIWIPVHFVLAAAPGTSLQQVHTVASHPQAYASTRSQLAKLLPHARFRPGASTADAARTLLTPEATHEAAICSPTAARQYGLNTLADLSAGTPHRTRFVRIAPHTTTTNPTGDDITSLALASPNLDLLSIAEDLAAHQVQVVRVHARPDSRAKPAGGYLWLDCRGHISEPPLAQAVARLQRRTGLHVVGSFPIHQPSAEVPAPRSRSQLRLKHRATKQYAAMPPHARQAADSLMSQIAADPQHCPPYHSKWPSQWRQGAFASWGLLTYVTPSSQDQAIVVRLDWSGDR